MKKILPVIFISVLSLASCKKDTLSKIPIIKFLSLTPGSIVGGSSLDTVYVSFHVQDGDADLGVPQDNQHFDMYIQDSRYTNLGFVGYYFPAIDGSAEDATKGLTGTITYSALAATITPRSDSLHMAVGDTLQYEIYIKDRAGHESNHITTSSLLIRPK